MFRCPSCGQGKEVTVRGSRREIITITMNDTMTDVEEFLHKHTHITGEEAKEVYRKKIERTKIDQQCECPKCHVSYSWKKWLDARENTLNYFEMSHEQLCHCGGELWMDQIPGTTSYGFVCEKCEWVKPKARVSGA